MQRADLSTDTHWNRFYSSASAPVLPSQFCVFVANEVEQPVNVVEFGCGNGRDSLFFARHGWPVIGVDASEAAITACRETARAQNTAAKFHQASVSDPGCYQTVRTLLADQAAAPLLVYARFFLHAIDQTAQTALLTGVRDLLGEHGGVFAVEFRTDRDASLNKTTEQHYRRFIKPADLVAEAATLGFDIAYFSEGFGFAKYKDDDAHVARLLLTVSQT